MTSRFQFPVCRILNTGIHAASLPQALEAIHVAIKEKRRLMIGVVNAAKIVNMSKDAELFEDVSGSDLVLADGMSVVLASKILGSPLPERVTGIDLMMGILAKGRSERYRVYCLGATEAVSQIVEDKIKEDFPGVQLVGRRNGYFSADEEAGIVEDIARLDVDVLFVAITSPKKERLMAKWSDQLNVTVVHGVGGSFDVMAGLVDRAPERWQRMGLEWLYRVKQEPGRLWKRYLVTNTAFIKMVLVAWIKGTTRGARP
ncbi:MAG: WecB/TagA/CpsF family glycosyltransferase [Gammaproteobacteria bacterium]|nr:WecB/TagA/CpsF family glycosyltransferase [Gammaproteobacteria bacterium]